MKIDKKIIIFAVCIVVTILSFGLVAAKYYSELVYSKGYRDGYIQKVSQKGFVFRTYEADIAQMGFGGSAEGKANQPSSGNVWSCSIIDEGIVSKMESFAGTMLVRVHYEERFWVPPWHGRTDYIVVKVEELGTSEVVPQRTPASP